LLRLNSFQKSIYPDLNIVLLALAGIVFGKNVAAAEWTLKGSLGQQLQYDDNISLNTLRKDSVAGYLLKPSLQAARKTESLDVALDGQGDIRRYDDSRWDCNSYNLNSNNEYRATRNIFNLSGGYSVSCSYAQQITDTGLLVPTSQAENYRLSPSWTWQWTPLDKLTLGTSYSKTSYSNSLTGSASNIGANFSGNDTYTVNLGGNHEWNRRLSLNEKLFFSNIQYTDSNASNQKLFGFQLGANYIVDHYWTVSASGGPLWVDTRLSSVGITSGQSSSLSLGSVANINLNYSDTLTQFSAGFSNSVNPSAIGQTLQTSSAFANYSYHLTEHLLLDISSNYSHSKSIGAQSSANSTNQFNRDYFTVALGIGWELAKNWKLRGSYVYRWQDYQQDTSLQNINAGTSDSNAVMLTLSYSWDGIQVSR
jgi:hypothetical protein